MKLKAKTSFKFGTQGLVVPEGFQCDVSQGENLTYVICDFAGIKIRIPSLAAHKYFPGFIKVTPDMLERAATSGSCQSIRGHRVEPDGVDPDGFPSILLVAGWI